MWTEFNCQLNSRIQQMLIIVIILDWVIHGLFRPLEVHVAVFVSAMSALYSTVFWGCLL
jgi:hypothetical protein